LIFNELINLFYFVSMTKYDTTSQNTTMLLIQLTDALFTMLSKTNQNDFYICWFLLHTHNDSSYFWNYWKLESILFWFLLQYTINIYSSCQNEELWNSCYMYSFLPTHQTITNFSLLMNWFMYTILQCKKCLKPLTKVKSIHS
jgi:hypothetical protein